MLNLLITFSILVMCRNVSDIIGELITYIWEIHYFETFET